MYPDYKIIIYDNNDIYNIVKIFNEKNLELIKTIKTGAILADVFRYLIIYLRGGYYSDLDCEPIKRIDQLQEMQYHGDRNNNLFIYPKNINIKNSETEFHVNPCSNFVLHTSATSKNMLKCFGHNYIKKDTRIILGYEYEKTWHSNLINDKTKKHLWTDNDIGICQWFFGSKPQEKLFLKCYKQSIENCIKIDSLDKSSSNYHYDVINGTGPLFFTKVINAYLKKHKSFKDKIAILPCDYFSCGSYNSVPSTKNKFIQHKFTGTWLK